MRHALAVCANSFASRLHFDDGRLRARNIKNLNSARVYLDSRAQSRLFLGGNIFFIGGKIKIVAAILHNRVWAALLLAGLILPVVVLGGAFARNSSFGILFNSSGIFCSLCRFWVVQDRACAYVSEWRTLCDICGNPHAV